MGSREKDHTTPHLSSLVVRPTDSGGGGSGVPAAGAAGGGSDYEPGEVRRDQPPYARSDRFHDSHGYRMHAGSVSPVRRRNTDHRYSPNFDHSSGPPHTRGFGGGRDPGRYRDYSPPYGRGREGGRFPVRGYDRHSYVPGSVRAEGGLPRNNPNVRPREGDWICSDPLCNNLNFARREYCNNCKRPRYGPAGSPRRGHATLPPITRRPGPPGLPMDRSPGRLMNGYRSPPRGWARDDPRDFRAGIPPPRYEGRFHDHLPLRRDRPDFPEDDYRDRGRFDRPLALDWAHRDCDREPYLGERKVYERRLPSPPPPPLPSLPPRGGQWPRDIRVRSRSPIRDRGAPPRKDYRRPMFVDRGRDDHRRGGRDAY